jgi:MoxR-like ATPase
VLRHRVITNFSAESEGITPDKVIDRLLETVSDQESGGKMPPEVARAFAKN